MSIFIYIVCLSMSIWFLLSMLSLFCNESECKIIVFVEKSWSNPKNQCKSSLKILFIYLCGLIVPKLKQNFLFALIFGMKMEALQIVI